MNALELKIPPVALVLVIAAAMWVAAQFAPGLGPAVRGAAWLAAGIATAGILVAVLGVLEFHRAGTTVNPRVPDKSVELVTSGVYRYSRNPMYAGFLLVLLGWGLFLNNLLSLLLLPVFVAYMARFQIHPEERFMRAKFGQAFSDYSVRVRRWI